MARAIISFHQLFNVYNVFATRVLAICYKRVCVNVFMCVVYIRVYVIRIYCGYVYGVSVCSHRNKKTYFKMVATYMNMEYLSAFFVLKPAQTYAIYGPWCWFISPIINDNPSISRDYTAWKVPECGIRLLFNYIWLDRQQLFGCKFLYFVENNFV